MTGSAAVDVDAEFPASCAAGATEVPNDTNKDTSETAHGADGSLFKDSAALAAAQKADANCRLDVWDVPANVHGAELADFLGGAVLAAAGHPNAVVPADSSPCLACGVGSGARGTVAFRTALCTSIALRLNGLECRGTRLRLSRPVDYTPPESGDPCGALRLGSVSLSALLGLGSNDSKNSNAAAGVSSDTATEREAKRAKVSSSTDKGESESQSKPATATPRQPTSEAGSAPRAEESKPQQEELKPPGNHYEALGLGRKATSADVKKAYHKMCRLLHPDKNHHDPTTTARFQRVAEAYQELSTPSKRAQYDATLCMQEACSSLGVQADPRAASFVQRHVAQPGREISSMQVESRIINQLIGNGGFQLQQLKQQSGADMLVLQNQLSAHAQVLMAGPPASVERAKALIQAVVGEISGMQAPRDGVVLMVPKSVHSRIPQAAAHFPVIFMQTGSAARLAAGNRIVVQGGLRVPQAVVQLQWALEWKADVLMPNGQQLDAWSYAHCCEAAGLASSPLVQPGGVYQYLLPPGDPDAPSVKHLLCLALNITEDSGGGKETLVKLATRALDSHRSGRPLTMALIRAATSVPVHAEHASLGAEAGADLLCAVLAVMPTAHKFVSTRFSASPFFKTLTAINTALTDAKEGLTLRARGLMSVREDVPEDGAWHAWETLAEADDAVASFWGDLCQWISERKQQLGVQTPPSEWLRASSVMAMVFRACAGSDRDVEIDVTKGIRRAITTKVPAPVSTPTPATGGTTVDTSCAGLAQMDDSRGDEGDQLTLVEHVEDALLGLAKSGSATFVQIGVLSQEVCRRLGDGWERPNKAWYEAHSSSFELKRFHRGQPDEWSVRLVPTAQARASTRLVERQTQAMRSRELGVAEQVLPKLAADLPRSLKSSELVALLCVLSRGHRVPEELPGVLLKRLCRKAEVTPKELLHETAPFPPALLMRAIVALDKKRKERWDKDILDIVLQASALDMHDVDARPRASLPTVAAALWAAARRPFDERLDGGRCLLVPSAALRLQVELAEHSALSPDASSFRAFAQMCAWLAHLVVTAKLSADVRAEVMQAFKKLAATCAELGRRPETAPNDPEGLCRLAMAVALVVREGEEKTGFGTDALDGLARICVEHAMDEAYEWRPQQLAVLASAFAAAEVSHDGLFEKIAVEAERHATLGNEWTTEQLLKLLNAASTLGQLAMFEKLLFTLQPDNGLVKYVQEANPRDLPVLFTVVNMLQDSELLEELLHIHKHRLGGAPLQGLVSMLRNWPIEETSALSSFKCAVVKECVAAATRKTPKHDELEVIVTAAASDPKAVARLTDLAASPALLASLPSPDAPANNIYEAVAGTLGPFTFGEGVDVPRLEAACASCLLRSLDKKPSLDAYDLIPALLLLSENAFASMPVMIDAVASHLRAMPPEALDARDVQELCERVVQAAGRLRGSRGSSDATLDDWVERAERAVLDDFRVNTGEKRFDTLEQQLSKRLSSKIKESLGPGWLGVLLVRSGRLTWRGGANVSLDPPRPRSATKRLAEATSLSSAAADVVLSLVPEPVPPRARQHQPEPSSKTYPSASSGPSSREVPTPSAAATPRQATSSKMPPGALTVCGGSDRGMAETLSGTFTPSSNNHGRAVYRRMDSLKGSSREGPRVLLYYWDDRDGAEQRGWWFGPEVGGEEVWAHNPGSPTSTWPPTRGWRVLHSGVMDPQLTVTRAETQTQRPPWSATGSAGSPPPRRTTPPAPAPSSAVAGLKRPRVDETRGEELRAWLSSLDDGAGAMLQYYDILCAEFDADVAQIGAAKVVGGEKRGILGVVDPSFWDTVRVEKTGHKMLFARGIAKL